jgi:hypothetical protein
LMAVEALGFGMDLGRRRPSGKAYHRAKTHEDDRQLPDIQMDPPP